MCTREVAGSDLDSPLRIVIETFIFEAYWMVSNSLYSAAVMVAEFIGEESHGHRKADYKAVG
jgi:hypothetical protein